MSHTSSVSTVNFQDESVLRAAIQELKSLGVKCELLENALPRAYFTNQAGMDMPARFVISLPESRYDVGLYPVEGKQGYEARFDEFMGDIAKNLGATPQSRGGAAIGKLSQTYAKLAIMRKAMQSGKRVTQATLPDGSIQLVVAA